MHRRRWGRLGLLIYASCDWSCAFPINEAGDLTIVSRLPDREKEFVSVDVQCSGSETRVVFATQVETASPTLT